MMRQRKLYISGNGDSWWLCCGGDRVFILHEANLSSGAKATQLELGDFLSSAAGPEHQALIRLIGRLAEID
jgi:hypothetical protein